MIRAAARPTLRRTEAGLIIAAGVVLLWAMAVLSVALFGHLAQSSLLLVVAALAMMLVVNLLLAWRLPSADQVILPMATMLTGLGLVMIRRLSPEYALRQLAGIGVGLLLLLIAALALRDYRLLQRYKYTLAACGFALIMGTKLFGVDPYGEGYKRWFGYHGFYYQPVELLKVLLVIFFAAYLDEKHEVLASAYLRLGRLKLPPLQYVGPLFTTWLLALGLLLFQNDLGSALLFFGIFLAMVYIAGPRRIYSLMGLAMVVAGALAAYQLNRHVRARIITWINPWPYVHTYVPGTHTSSWQLVQALIALASGGIPGTGLGQGAPRLIPVARTDFIFSAVGEELGLLGTMFILACYLVFAYRGLRIAVLARDPFDKLLAAGLTSAVVIQALVIIGGNIRLIPIAGVTLPFMSYGPSSLLSNYIIVGMLLRISAHAPRARREAEGGSGPAASAFRPPPRHRAMINYKIGRLAQLFLILFAITVALLFYWQVVDANYLMNRPENQRLYLAQHAIHRGAIYDRYGVALARTTFEESGTPRRTYPDPSLGALLGYHSWRYGNAGLEAAYNDYLNGQAVLQPVDNPIRRLLHEPVIGDDLHLTIDARIQQIVMDAMGRGPGACIVADPRTGAILALESQPWFDPNRVEDTDYWNAMRARTDSPFSDRALQGLYPPGSTFKAITLAAAYDSRKDTPSTVIAGQDATGPLYVDGYLLRSAINNLPPGVSAVTTVDAFKYSDNIAFATIGMNLGPRILVDYAQRFGFGRTIPFPLPVRQSSVTAHPDSFSQLDLAESAFGQGGVLATPLQMLLVDEAIADGGAEPQPYVVASIRAPNREVLQQTAPGVWEHPISARTAAQMKAAMTAVVEAPGGSGVLARVPGVTVAGKTGTAQAPSGPPHAWFIGFAPAAHPRLAVVVFKEHGGEGYSQAAPIAGSIIRQALPLVR